LRALLTRLAVIIETIKGVTRGDWKVLVVDEESRKLIDNVVREDDILNQNITSAHYLLLSQSHLT
jgi:hypothetical protein